MTQREDGQNPASENLGTQVPPDLQAELSHFLSTLPSGRHGQDIEDFLAAHGLAPVDGPCWDRLLTIWGTGITRATLETWIKPLQAFQSDHTVYLLCPTRQSVEFVNARLLRLLLPDITATFGEQTTVQFLERSVPHAQPA